MARVISSFKVAFAIPQGFIWSTQGIALSNAGATSDPPTLVNANTKSVAVGITQQFPTCAAGALPTVGIAHHVQFRYPRWPKEG